MTTIPMLEKELEQAYKDIEYYKNRNEKLNNKLQQKENIIKEVREYAGKLRLYDNESIEFEISNDLFRILDKENRL